MFVLGKSMAEIEKMKCCEMQKQNKKNSP